MSSANLSYREVSQMACSNLQLMLCCFSQTQQRFGDVTSDSSVHGTGVVGLDGSLQNSLSDSLNCIHSSLPCCPVVTSKTTNYFFGVEVYEFADTLQCRWVRLQFAFAKASFMYWIIAFGGSLQRPNIWIGCFDLEARGRVASRTCKPL